MYPPDVRRAAPVARAMTTAASGLCGNPRRVMQLLWLVAAFMFAVALVRSLVGGTDTGTGRSGRLSMAEHMHAAERAWGKTVKQRHELIRKDFGDVEKLPL